MTDINQKQMFVASEADQWYLRNKEKIVSSIKIDPVVDAIQHLHITPKKILEIGCSNGWRLNDLNKKYGSSCTGIEPSAVAVNEGSKAFPQIILKNGTADRLDFENESFDCVIAGFCLYLCDRKDLFKISAEIDKVLSENGFLLIYDFCPPVAYKNNYIHCKGIDSYKMDYSSMFLWNSAYIKIYHRILSHSLDNGYSNPDERISVTILQKNSEWAYIEEPKWKK